jgi:GxxExxY protein
MFARTGHELLTESIIGCGIRVHQHFGPGLLESVYCKAFAIELRVANLTFDVNRRIPLTYRGVDLETAFQADLIVEDQVIVEVKAVEQLAHVHSAQVITYLKLTGCPVGLIMNFNVPFLRQGIRRVVRPDIYQRKSESSGQNEA